MKVNRINIVVPTALNKHRKYLYNEMLDFMQVNKLGGEFRNEHIKVNSMPEPLLNILKELQIIFEVIKK